MDFEYTKEELMKLEISIIRIKHEMKNIEKKFPSSYRKDANYVEYEKKLEKKLSTQKIHDYKRFIVNCPVEKQTKFDSLIQKNIDIYNNLGLSEKEFLNKHKYDYKNDPLKLFSNSPLNNELSFAWRELKAKKNTMSNLEYYKDRDWNS